MLTSQTPVPPLTISSFGVVGLNATPPTVR